MPRSASAAGVGGWVVSGEGRLMIAVRAFGVRTVDVASPAAVCRLAGRLEPLVEAIGVKGAAACDDAKSS